MGYTIVVREQVTPKFTLSNGPTGQVSRITPVPEFVPPASFVRRLYSPLAVNQDGIYEADPVGRSEVWEDVNGTATDAEVFAGTGIKNAVIGEIKQIRALALEKITKNSGVLAIYSENYTAALAVKGGTGDTTIMKDGQTATAYLSGFGARLGMTPAQFADYIIAENRRVNPTAYAVEEEYLRLAYTVIPGAQTVTEVLDAPAQYLQFCGV